MLVGKSRWAHSSLVLPVSIHNWILSWWFFPGILLWLIEISCQMLLFSQSSKHGDLHLEPPGLQRECTFAGWSRTCSYLLKPFPIFLLHASGIATPLQTIHDFPLRLTTHMSNGKNSLRMVRRFACGPNFFLQRNIVAKVFQIWLLKSLYGVSGELETTRFHKYRKTAMAIAKSCRCHSHPNWSSISIKTIPNRTEMYVCESKLELVCCS